MTALITMAAFVTIAAGAYKLLALAGMLPKQGED